MLKIKFNNFQSFLRLKKIWSWGISSKGHRRVRKHLLGAFCEFEELVVVKNTKCLLESSILIFTAKEYDDVLFFLRVEASR